MYRTAYSVANEVRMARSQFSGAFLIAEGDTDARLWERFVADGHCRIIDARGKQTAVEAIQIIDASSVPGVVAVVDADFDRITNKSCCSTNVVTSDSHDLETILMASPALDKVLLEFGSPQKISEFERLAGRTVRESLFNEAMTIGMLRLVSEQDGLFLKFEGCKYQDFVDRESLLVDKSKLIRSIKNNSQQHTLDEVALEQRLLEVEKMGLNSEELCCGHDLSGILSIALRKAIGTCNPTQVDPDSLERSLRIGYEGEYLKATNLYSELKAWEAANPPYQILLE